MNRDDLPVVLAAHKGWLDRGRTGEGRANFTRADLRGANLIDAVLAGADLRGANFTNADLCGADLTDAVFIGTVLANADLRGADLTGANFTNAVLTGVDLTDAVLTDADLTNAVLTCAASAIDAGTPDGWRCVGWMRGGRLSIRVGCRDKRLDEGRAYWGGKSDRAEVFAALDYVEAVAKLRRWQL
jgi:hypothetical protein